MLYLQGWINALNFDECSYILGTKIDPNFSKDLDFLHKEIIDCIEFSNNFAIAARFQEIIDQKIYNCQGDTE